MLTKLYRTTYYPGSPEIPYRPEVTLCDPEPPPSPPHDPPGQWVLMCESTDVPIGWDYGPASINNPGPFPMMIYALGPVVCTYVWVPA